MSGYLSRVLSRSLSGAACLLLSQLSAPAQGAVLFVDDNGGAYTDIQAAVDAALPGDRIVVRAGNYSGFTVSGKGVWIVGQPGAQIVGFGGQLETLTIYGVPAGQICAVSSIALGGATVSPLEVKESLGLVVLDKIVDGTGNSGARRFLNNRQVIVNGCILPRVHAMNTNISLLDTTSVGLAALFGFPGLDLTDSVAYVSRCNIDGASSVLPAPAIRLSNSLLRLTGDNTTMLRAGSGGAGRSAIEGSGALFLDDDVSLSPTGGKPAIGAGVAVTAQNIPSLAVNGAPIGGTVTIDLYSESGELFFILAGVPGGVIPLPVFKGDLWLNPIVLIPVLSGTLNGSARTMAQYTVPNSSVFIGVTTGFQAFTGNASALTVSNPATATYPM
jgi:hypothetical protein